MVDIKQKLIEAIESGLIQDEQSLKDFAGSLPILTELEKANVSLETLAKKEPPEVFKMTIEGIEVITLKGDSPTDEHLLGLIKPLIPVPEKGDHGDDYVLTDKDKEDIARKITVPVVEKVIEIQNQPIVTNEIKEVAVAETAEEIRGKIESLKGEERVDVSAIKGIDEKFKEVEGKIESLPTGGFRANNATRFYPLTPDGVTKVFTVPKNVACIVLGSDFPYILMENNGFTMNRTRTQITLTVDNAPSTDSQLLFQYSSMFNL